MNRPLLTSERVTPAALNFMFAYHQKTIDEVTAAIGTNRIVVVGMAQNPFVKKVRKALSAANVDFIILNMAVICRCGSRVWQSRCGAAGRRFRKCLSTAC